MFAKSNNGRNKITVKQITLYSLFVTVCIIVGYLESLLSATLVFIAPGVKLGLSNAVVMLLIFSGDKKGAFAVNFVRICLSALIFGTPISFVLSLAGGIASVTAACILQKVKSVSVIGVSIACAVIHNIFQLAASVFFVGTGVLYYLPLLIFLGALCGAVCGFFEKLVLNKTNFTALLK